MDVKITNGKRIQSEGGVISLSLEYKGTGFRLKIV
jgi:hypothetical protein